MELNKLNTVNFETIEDKEMKNLSGGVEVIEYQTEIADFGLWGYSSTDYTTGGGGGDDGGTVKGSPIYVEQNAE